MVRWVFAKVNVFFVIGPSDQTGMSKWRSMSGVAISMHVCDAVFDMVARKDLFYIEKYLNPFEISMQS